MHHAKSSGFHVVSALFPEQSKQFAFGARLGGRGRGEREEGEGEGECALYFKC